MEALRRLKPNEELKDLSKYDHILRQKGFNAQQIFGIKSLLIQNQREAEWIFCQEVPMVMLGIFANVLHGNNYMSRPKIKLALEEACTLFSEVDLGLLDWDDIENYNIKNMDCTIEFQQKDKLVESCKGEFKISGMKSTMERAREVMDQENAELESLLNAANQTGTPEVIEAAYTYFKEYNRIKDALKKAGVLG